MSAVYLQNKYTRWYNNIIEQAKNRQLANNVYREKHHIVPRSIGGQDDPENLVFLTAREHFVCHLLLTKMTTGLAKRSMAYAAWRMTMLDGRSRYVPSSKIYEYMKKNLSICYKGVKKKSVWWKDKKHTPATLEKQSMKKRGENNPMWGRQQTAAARQSIKEKQQGIPKPKFFCATCDKWIGGKSNYLRWHTHNS